MNKPITLEEKIIHLEHLLERVLENQQIVLKNQQGIKAHLWTEGKKLDKPIGIGDIIKFQEEQAEEYVENILKPKFEQKTEGDFTTAGFFDGVVLNWLKEQALIAIGQALRKIFLEVSVDLAKWLMNEAENLIVKLYNKATDEEKATFKEKVKEVFPDSELLKKLN